MSQAVELSASRTGPGAQQGQVRSEDTVPLHGKVSGSQQNRPGRRWGAWRQQKLKGEQRRHQRGPTVIAACPPTCTVLTYGGPAPPLPRYPRGYPPLARDSISEPRETGKEGVGRLVASQFQGRGKKSPIAVGSWAGMRSGRKQAHACSSFLRLYPGQVDIGATGSR
jgi:hypothetical protein